MSDKRKYLTIDLGGTAIKHAVMDEDLTFFEKGVIDARTTEEQYFFEDIRGLWETYGSGCEGLAISMPGVIDRRRGIARTGGAYMWVHDRPLARELEELLGTRVAIVNDGKAATYAEVGFGNLRDVSVGVTLVLGTGIGGGYVIDGNVVDGAHFTAAEFSMLRANIDPTTNEDHWVFYNGVIGLKAAIRQTSGLDDVDGLEAFRLIREEHNEQVLEGVRLFCWHLAHHIYNIQAVLDAERFVLAGGIMGEPTFLGMVQEAVDRKFAEARWHLLHQPEIMPCKFRRDANLVGALYSFMELAEE